MRRRGGLILASLVLAAAACGGDEPTVTPPIGTDTTTTPPATTSPTSSPTAAGNAIDVLDNQYQPIDLTVPVGSAVVWTHKGAASHTVTAADRSFDSSPDCPTNLSACMDTGDVFRFTFTRAGRFDYSCKVHGPLMSGAIVVQ